MPPRRRTAAPPLDVQDLRSRLDQGKVVRVAIAHSAQFPAGTVGRVRHIGDPEVDGEEFINVELTVNGTKDQLPFAPADLAAPTRASAVRSAAPNGSAGSGRSARATPTPAPGAIANPTPPVPARTADAGPPGEPLIPPSDDTATRIIGTTAADAPTNGAPTNGAPTAGAPTNDGPSRGRSAPAVDRVFFGAAEQGPAADPPARPKAVRAKPATKRRGPAVAISLGTTDADPPQWRIEAKVGSKVVLRNGSVPPARVWELVGMLGDETLTRAVGTVLDEQRQAAQSRADALAAELAAVRAELAELPEPNPAPAG